MAASRCTSPARSKTLLRLAPLYFDVPPFADRALAVTRNAALARQDVLLAHQPQRESARSELERHIHIASHFGAIDAERHPVRRRIINDVEMMLLTDMCRVAHFFEQAEI